MKALPSFLALVVLGSSLAPLRAEDSKRTWQEANARTKAPSKAEKKKAAHPATDTKAGAEAANRLKTLEQENLRLKQELTQKSHAPGTPPAHEAASPEAALGELISGNGRFVAGLRSRSQMGYNDVALRATLAKGQAPFAVIVTCSDSRLVDNFIFDQELGRLFTVREAGNCPDTQGLASIEYAVEHLGAKVVVVMGHEACGAVKAVLESGPSPLPGNLWIFQAAMSGLLESVPHPTGEAAKEHLSHLVEANAVRQAQVVVARSTLVQHLTQAKKLTVVPAVYDLASGKVRFLPAAASDAAAPAEAHH